MNKNSSVLGDINRARELHKQLKDTPEPPSDDVKHWGKSGLAGLLVYLMTKKDDEVIAEYEGKPVIRRAGAWDKYIKPLALGAGTTYAVNKILKSAEDAKTDDSAKDINPEDADLLDRVSDYAAYGKWGARGSSLLALRTGWHGYNDWRGASRDIGEFNDVVRTYENGVPAYEENIKRLEEIAQKKYEKAVGSAGKETKFRDPKHVEQVKKNIAKRNLDAIEARNRAETAKTTAPARPQPWEVASRNPNITLSPAKVNSEGVVTHAKPKVRMSTKLRGIGGFAAAPLMWLLGRKLKEAQDALHNDAKRVRGM